MRVTPRKRTTLTESLLTQLRRQVLSGRLAPGQQIPSEFALCEAFNVGRTTVREALRGLEAAGFVRRSGKRLIVLDPRQLAPEERDYAALAARVSVRDVYESRKLLEMQIARLVAEQHSDIELGELAARLQATETADQPGFHSADAEFHSALATLCNNPVLGEIYEQSRSLFFHLPTYWRLFPGSADTGRQQGIDGASGGHRRIYEAIVARDSVAAARAVFDHLDVVEKRLIAFIDAGTPTNESRPAAPATGPESEVSGAKER